MGRQEFARRRAALRSVLEHAAREPSAGLPFDRLPEVVAVFGSRRELLLALHLEWTRALWARIESVSLERAGGRRARRMTRRTDPHDVVRQAWQHCAACHPVLRELLDRYGDELAPGPALC